MAKHKSVTPEQAEIIRRNGFDPEKVSIAVIYSDEDCIRFLVHRTRDTITIIRGDKKW